MNVTKEYRFAIVMYGGISLAVYINGVAQELLNLVSSTAKGRRRSAATPSALIRVYQKVAARLSRKEQPKWENHDDICVRFVVDIITGASAGGINGIFLAKALSNDQELGNLRSLWIEQADLGLLLNDKRSVLDLKQKLQPQDPPQALLSGPRLYCELLEAFRRMGADPGPNEHYSDLRELDLFVTATDAWGQVLPLRLFDKFVWERRYKSVFHFRYRDPEAHNGQPCMEQIKEHQARRNDFVLANNEFLAFAARCTSSFPFAFEPIKLNNLKTWLASTGVPGEAQWNEWIRLFFDHPTRPQYNATQWVEPEERVYVDGGCLDNKPFGYVTRTLQERTRDVAVERKLIYVEPSPDHPEMEPVPRNGDGVLAPDAVQNAVRALTVLPLDETIREDLEVLLERNRDIERLHRLIQDVENEILSPGISDGRPEHIRRAQEKWDNGSGVDQTANAAQTWASQGLRSARIDRNDKEATTDLRYRGYSRLKVATVTDDLALLICALADYRRDSHEYFAVRCLIKKYRDLRYSNESKDGHTPAEGPTPAHFLMRFDFSYRLRRLEFVLRRVNRLIVLAAQMGEPVVESEKRALNSLLQTMVPGCPEWPNDWYNEGYKDFHDQLQFMRDHINCALQILRLGIQNLHTPVEKTPEEQQGRSHWSNRDAVATAIANLHISTPVLYQILGSGGDSDHPKEVDFTFDEEQVLERAGEVLSHPGIAEALSALDDTLNNVLHRLFDDAIAEISKAFYIRTQEERISLTRKAAIRLTRYNYDFFDDYDSILYPISYGTNLGEGAPVDVIRVSPDDATSIIDESETHTQKLAGVKLGHFGAFLDQVWRRNDILWGRLDGAERIIESLLLGAMDPAAPKDSKGQFVEIADLIREAHAAIINEELGDTGLADIRRLFIESVIQIGTTKLPDRDAMTATVQQILGQTTGRINTVLQAALQTNHLLDCMKDYRVNPIPNRETTLESAGRAATVLGNMFQDLSFRSDLPSHWTRWLAWGGVALSSLVEISTPRKLTHWFARYWFALAAFISVIMIGLGALVGEPAAQKLGIKFLLITVVAYLIVLILSSFIVSAGKSTFLKSAWKNSRVFLKFAFYVAAGLLLLWVAIMGTHDAVHLIRTGGISGLWISFKNWISEVIRG